MCRLLDLALKVHGVGLRFAGLLAEALVAARGVERLRSEKGWWVQPSFDSQIVIVPNQLILIGSIVWLALALVNWGMSYFGV